MQKPVYCLDYIMAKTRERKKSLKEVAYERISEYILTNDLHSGDLLPTEKELTQIAETSRTPVREALTMLEQEGVVEIIPRKGIIITHISFKDVRELFHVREAIEGMAARIAAVNINQERLTEIEEMFEKAFAEENADRKLDLFDEADDCLHRFILEQSGNQRLLRVSKSYSTILRMEIKISNSLPGIAEKFHTHHEILIKAFRAKDPDAAEKAMRYHISEVYKNILVAYESNMYSPPI